MGPIMREHIHKILKERVCPQLVLHNGGLEPLDIQEHAVHIRLLGQCAHCPASHLTTRQVILAEPAKALPGAVECVVEEARRESLPGQARRIPGGPHGCSR